MKFDMSKVVYTKGKLVSVTEKEGKKGPYLLWVFITSDNQKVSGFTDLVPVAGGRLVTWLRNLGKLSSSSSEEITNIPCYIAIGEKGFVVDVAREGFINSNPEPTTTTPPVTTEAPKATKPTPTEEASKPTVAQPTAQHVEEENLWE